MNHSLWKRGERWLLLLEYDADENKESCPVSQWCTEHGITLNRFQMRGYANSLQWATAYQANIDSAQALEFKMRWV